MTKTNLFNKTHICIFWRRKTEIPIKSLQGEWFLCHALIHFNLQIQNELHKNYFM